MNFATPAAIFASSFILGLSGALMPGPLLAVAVRDSARRGFSAAPLLIVGHGILEGGMVALLLLGFAEFLNGKAATAVISLVGGATLLWMAVGMARDVRTLAAPGAESSAVGGIEPARPGAGSPARSVVDGIVVSVSNPYWTIWWATIGLGCLAVSRPLGAAGIAAFYAGHILSDFAWYMFVGAAVSMGRARLSDRLYRGIVGCCAVFLVFFGFYFGYLGTTTLLRLP